MDRPGSEFMCRSASLYEVFEAEADLPQPVEAPCIDVWKLVENPTNGCDFSVITDHHVDAVDTGETHREDRQEKDQKDSEDQSERWPKRQP